MLWMTSYLCTEHDLIVEMCGQYVATFAFMSEKILASFCLTKKLSASATIPTMDSVHTGCHFKMRVSQSVCQNASHWSA